MAQTHARNTDPVSSHEAAQSNAAIRHIQVYEVVKQLGSQQLTTAEVARKADLDRHLVAKRMPDAESRGFVRRAGFRECTVSGRKVLVWVRTKKPLPTE